jgi:hypothetical protein
MGADEQKILNGKVLGATHPTTSQKNIDLVRAAIHNLAAGRVPEDERANYLASVIGKIRHVEFINPRQAVPLNRRLQNALIAL